MRRMTMLLTVVALMRVMLAMSVAPAFAAKGFPYLVQVQWTPAKPESQANRQPNMRLSVPT